MPDSSVATLSRELQALHRLLLRAEAGSLGLSADPYKLMGAAMSDSTTVTQKMLKDKRRMTTCGDLRRQYTVSSSAGGGESAARDKH